MSQDRADGMSRRERQIMDVVYRLGEATVADVQRELADRRATPRCGRSCASSRRRATSGTRKPARATSTRRACRGTRRRRSALRRLLRNFFDDSRETLVAALLDDEASQLSPGAGQPRRPHRARAEGGAMSAGWAGLLLEATLKATLCLGLAGLVRSCSRVARPPSVTSSGRRRSSASCCCPRCGRRTAVARSPWRRLAAADGVVAAGVDRRPRRVDGRAALPPRIGSRSPRRARPGEPGLPAGRRRHRPRRPAAAPARDACAALVVVVWSAAAGARALGPLALVRFLRRSRIAGRSRRWSAARGPRSSGGSRRPSDLDPLRDSRCGGPRGRSRRSPGASSGRSSSCPRAATPGAMRRPTRCWCTRRATCAGTTA